MLYIQTKRVSNSHLHLIYREKSFSDLLFNLTTKKPMAFGVMNGILDRLLPQVKYSFICDVKTVLSNIP